MIARHFLRRLFVATKISGFEKRVQCSARTADPTLHGTHRDAGNLGDPFLGKAARGDHDQSFALDVRQHLQRHPDIVELESCGRAV